MRKSVKTFLRMFLTFIISAHMTVIITLISASANELPKLHPTTNHGKKWRIGYYEGGPYINYPANLKAIIKGLMELGWIESKQLPRIEDQTDSSHLWNALSKIDSRYIVFDSNAFWSAGWKEDTRRLNRQKTIGVLKNHKLDLIIAMGTWAGQDLCNNEHSVPTMVVSTSNPIQAKIIKSAYDSGYAHVHAKCDPTRYLRQIRLFHNIVGFKKLGIVYENSLEGRTYSAIDDVKKVAKERGFEVITCEAPFSGVSQAAASKAVADCHAFLAPKVDAVYITVHRGVIPKYMPQILAPLMKYKIPTFSMRGPDEVKYGVLFSISRRSFVEVGRFHAKVIAQIFNGKKPGQINQIFQDPKKIAINLKTAQEIEFIVPPAFMMVADKIYREIETVR